MMIRGTLFQIVKQSNVLVKNLSQNRSFSSFFTNNISKRKNLGSLLAGVSGLSIGTYICRRHEILYSNLEASDEKIHSEKWTLYQYATCPFCCKVRTFLDYYGIAYDIVEVNPVSRKEIKFSDYRKVPFMMFGEKQLNDSSLIVSVLKTHLITGGEISKILSYYPVLEREDGKKSFDYQNRYNVMYETGLGMEGHKRVREEMKWRRWVDEVFVHTLSPNIYRTVGESLQAMEYITKVGNFSNFERTLIYYSGAITMYLIGKRLKHRHHLRNDVRESLYEETHRWLKAVGKDRPFLGGDEPNLADLNMYGVLSAIEGYDAFHDLLKNTNIGPWYNRMQRKVHDKEGVQEVERLRLALAEQ